VVFGAILVPAVAVCSDDEPLAAVSYHGSVSVASQRKAYVELVTGEVKRHRIDEDILPHWITKGSQSVRYLRRRKRGTVRGVFCFRASPSGLV
jgi:hypothetical protein